MAVKPTRPKLSRSPDHAKWHSRERSELQQLALDFIIHELGNAASPVLMIAEVMERDATCAAGARSAKTLRGTASNLRELSEAIRFLRGDASGERLTPRTFVNTAAWWNRMLPLCAACLDRSVRLTNDVASVAADEHALGALTWCTLGVLRLISSAFPAVREVTVRCDAYTQTDVSISLAVPAEMPGELTATAQRWQRFVAAEAEGAGAKFSVLPTSAMTTFAVSL